MNLLLNVHRAHIRLAITQTWQWINLSRNHIRFAITQTARMTMNELIALRPQRRNTVGNHTGSSNYNEWILHNVHRDHIRFAITQTTRMTMNEFISTETMHQQLGLLLLLLLESGRDLHVPSITYSSKRNTNVGNHTDNSNEFLV